MDAAPTEYLWHYNPVTGRVGGANQNYGERINILHSNRYLYNRMQEAQRAKNEIVTQRGLKAISGDGFSQFVPAAYQTADDEEEIYGGQLPPDTVDPLKQLADIALQAEEARVKAEPALTTRRFVREFPPVVYEDPFSGSNFAFEFNPLYNPSGNDFSHPNSIPGGDARGGAVNIAGSYPKLHGGAVTFAGKNPILGSSPYGM
ncbi:pVIII protein [Raptor adenovirus 1]|uniref:PVIII protein n=1 Tax=Raptor adenovirus 1 TaxID=1520002 RepID=F4MI08_9ADEN|nr:pVIII protein [Raptor adenovirus 1]AEC32103.1 pVIII protein [Raptor adenovirus 1]